MRCYYCNREIPDDALFCPECGASLEVQEEMSSSGGRICPGCGSLLQADDRFCPECGMQISEDHEETERLERHQGYTEDRGYRDRSEYTEGRGYRGGSEYTGGHRYQDAPQNGKKGSFVPVLLAVLAVIVVLLIMGVAGVTLYKKVFSEKKDETKVEEHMADEADINLLETDTLQLKGVLRVTGSGQWALQWDTDLDFYGRDESGQEVFIDDIETAYLDLDENVEGALDMTGLNEEVTVKGSAYIAGGTVYIMPDQIYDSDGREMIGMYEAQLERERLEEEQRQQEEEARRKEEEERQKEEEEEQKTDDYMIPDSDKVVLTREDVAGLSLREINYAKNEIYARHGRKFKSKELQEYFNSKSWYHPVTDAEDFSESVLSDVEKKNVQLLKDVEFEMMPGGYPLDAD